MALEQVFECPRTIGRLRSDPIGKLLEGFCSWLLEHGFSRWSIRTHLSNLSHLNEYLGSLTASPRATVTAKDVEGFLRAYPSESGNRGPLEQHLHRFRYSVNRFTDYLRQKGLFDPLAQSPIYQPLLDAYLQWMRHYQHASEGTLEVRSHSMTQFLQWLGTEATPGGLFKLTAERIEKFFLSYAQSMGCSARHSMQSALRSFLRFCLHQGYIERPLDLAVPTLRTYKLATLPRGLSDTEAQQVLRYINRNSHAGRRDYAMVQLLYTYGVWKLHSSLAVEIQNFIHLRRLSGTDYQSQAQLLGYFDRFVLDQHLSEPRLTREITDGYLQSLSHLAPRSRSNRFCVVRQLCQYLARSDPRGYVPEPLRVIPSQGAHPPYIYSPAEIQALLAAASKLPPANSLRPHTYRTLLGLLYSTGIRIGEALALNLDDFQSTEQRLYIAKGKFRKARWVPLSTSTSQALQQSLRKRLQMGLCSPESPLLLNQRSRRLTPCTVNQTFRYLLRQCGICHSKLTGPRIHDLRHTFAVQRLLAWYRDGQDVNARLPWLATYMGHVDVHSTQVYLQATPELIAQVDRRFYNHYLHQVKPQGGTP